MIIKTIEELREADERTLRFKPLGFGSRMRPEDSAEFQQKVVARFDLAPAVAEGTRQSFERLRTVFAYGVLCYEIFTLVEGHALLIIEQAFRDRFIDFHQGTVTFVDNAGTEHPVAATRYEQVHDVANANRRWKLRLIDGRTMDFKGGMLAGLREWARQTGLLRGQHNHGIEQALSNLRNFVAHANGYHLDGPVEAAETLSDLAEIINQLWGVPTPGGRLFPAPLRRDVVAIAWNVAGTRLNITSAEYLACAVDPTDEPWRCVVVRAFYRPDQYLSDPGLHHYDSLFEVTRYPADWLWGAGTITDAAAWYAEHQPAPDECDYLDRTFLIRHDGNDLYLPMRSSIAGALADEDCNGVWYAINADHPNDAYSHVRNVISQTGCNSDGRCRQCHCENLATGQHQAVLTAIGYQPGPTASLPNDAKTPWANVRFHEVGG